MEIDQEALASSVLKERTKELKLATKRLQKVEERYVAKHRENSDLMSDRNVLLIFMSILFPDQEFTYNYGSVTLDRFEMLYQGKEEEHRRVLQQTNNNFNEEIAKLKAKLSTLQEELKAKDLELKELNALHAEVFSLQALSVELRGELEYADKQIEDLKVDNAKMKAQQNEFAKNRANSLLAALDSREEVEGDKTSLLQTQLAEAELTIQELTARLKGSEGTGSGREAELTQNVLLEAAAQRTTYEEHLFALEKQLSCAQHEFLEHRRRAQKLMMEKDLHIDKLKAKLQQASLDSEDTFIRSRMLEVEPQPLDSSLEYLKNIVLKFMEYIYAGYMREAQTLAGVIFTVMDFTPEEVELVRKAQDEKGVINSMAGLFAVKSPGSGVSYNTLHTNEGRRRANLPPLSEGSRVESA